MALEKEMIRLENLKIEQQAKQEALRADLLRMISHDLRTPLTSISGNAGLLLENDSAFTLEKKKELYQDIYNDAMWLYDLVENLLFITRIENGTMQLNLQPEMIEDIFREAIHLESKTTVSIFPVNGNMSTQHIRFTAYPRACSTSRSLARLVGLQEI